MLIIINHMMVHFWFPQHPFTFVCVNGFLLGNLGSTLGFSGFLGSGFESLLPYLFRTSICFLNSYTYLLLASKTLSK